MADSVQDRPILGDADGTHHTLFDVSERERARLALEESEGRLRAIVENAVDGIITIDERGIVASLNPAAVRLFGYAPQEVIGKNVNMLMPAPYREEHDGYLKNYRNTGIKKIIGIGREVVGRRKDGTLFPMDLAVSEILLGNRRIFTGIVRDITDRVRAEETRASLAEIVESSDDAIIGKTLKGIITSWNGGAERIFGYSPGEVIGKSILLLIPHDRQHEEADIQERLARGERMEHFETVRLARDGRKIDVSLTVSPIRNSTGKIVGASKIIRDITGQKLAEESLKLRSAELATSEERFRLVANSIPQLAWMAKPDGWIFWYNQRWYDYTGTTAQDMEGWGWERVHDPAELPRVVASWKAALASGKPWEDTFPLRRHDGEMRMHLSRAMPLSNEHGEVVLWFGTNTDTENQRRNEQALARQTEELARSNLELERFAYIASHDLQEPMRTVQRFGQLLQRNLGTQLDADSTEYLGFIAGGLKRMQTLISDLLAYSRVGSHGGVFASADCNLICASALENLHASIESNRAEVTVDPLPVLIGDATQLGQLFQNLLVNAIKFHGERLPRIRVSAKEGEREWTFSVQDNGIGIAPQYFDRIFIIFQRLHTIEEYGGTGIGLAICKKIAERHGGRIWVESVVGEGTTFYFSIEKRKKIV